jgi:hypothetical protein
MNTGIQGAVALAARLTAVVRDERPRPCWTNTGRRGGRSPPWWWR